MSNYRILSSEGSAERLAREIASPVVKADRYNLAIVMVVSALVIGCMLFLGSRLQETKAVGNSLADKLAGYCETEAQIAVYTNTTNFVGSAVECGMDFIAIKSDSFGSARRYIIPHEAIKVIQEMK